MEEKGRDGAGSQAVTQVSVDQGTRSRRFERLPPEVQDSLSQPWCAFKGNRKPVKVFTANEMCKCKWEEYITTGHFKSNHPNRKNWTGAQGAVDFCWKVTAG